MSRRDWGAVLADAKERGLSMPALARELECSANCIWYQCEKHGVRLAPGRHGIEPKADWKAVLTAAARAGETLGDVAEKVGVSKPAVLKHARRHGIRLRGQRAPEGTVPA